MTAEPEFQVGDLYEDCAYHPCRCTRIEGDTLCGVSLIDGTSPRGCDLYHCGPEHIDDDQARAIVADFDRYAELRQEHSIADAVTRLHR